MTRFNPKDADVAELLELQPTLHGLAARVLAGRDGTDDAVQDVWMSVLQKAGLTRVARPRGLERLIDSKARSKVQRDARRRHHERRAGAARERTSPSAASAVERAEVRRVVLEEVLALDPHLCEVLVLRFVEERSTEEVASLLGIAQATVRTRVHRALPQLRERLERRFGEGGESWLAALAPLALATLPQAVGAKASTLGGAGAAALAAALLTTVLAVLFGLDRSPTAVRPSAQDESIALVEPTPSGERVPVPDAGLVVGGIIVGPVRGDVDGELAPIARTTLRATVRRGFDTLFNATVETDDEGRFRLPLEDRGASTNIDVTITRDGSGPWRAFEYRSRFTVQAPTVDRALDGDQAAELAQLRLQLVAKGDVVVYVQDSSGAPIEGARLRFLRKGAPKTRIEAIFSNAEGRAALRQVDDYEFLNAEVPGSVLVEGGGGEKLEAGGFEPIALLMAEAATLRIESTSQHSEEPQTQQWIKVDLAPSEPLLAGSRWGWVADKERERPSALEDAVFEGVPAGRRLALTIQGPLGVVRGVASRANLRGELIFDSRTSDTASIQVPTEQIVLEAGSVATFQTTTLSAASVERRSLRVTAPSGASLRWARAQLFEVAEVSESNGAAEVPMRPRAFGGCVAGESPNDLILTGPFARAPESRVLLTVFARAEGGGALRCDALLPLGEPDVDAETPLEITLRALNRISGEVRGGANQRYCIASRGETRRLLGSYRMVSSELRAGRFESVYLYPGPFEFFVQPKDELCFESLGTFDAGSDDLQLALPPTRSTTLTVNVEAGDTELRRAWVGVVHSSGDRPEEALLVAPGGILSDPLGPDSRDRGFFRTSATGTPVLGATPLIAEGKWGSGTTAELPSPAPGWMLVVAATSSETDIHAGPGPMRAASSGWFRHVGGDLDLRFELVPAAQVSGRISSIDTRVPLRVAVLDDRGRRVQLRGGGTFGDSLPVAANGRFRIDDAPMGNVRLQFGTRAELDARRPRRDFPVRLAQGENPTLDLE